MSRIGRVAVLIKLAAVETKDKQAQSTLESIGTVRETTRRSGQTSQVVLQFSDITFHREGVCFALRDFMSADVIPKPIVGIKSIAAIAFRLGRIVHHRLNNLLGALPDHFPAQITACVSVYEREDVDPVFCRR